MPIDYDIVAGLDSGWADSVSERERRSERHYSGEYSGGSPSSKYIQASRLIGELESRLKGELSKRDSKIYSGRLQKLYDYRMKLEKPESESKSSYSRLDDSDSWWEDSEMYDD